MAEQKILFEHENTPEGGYGIESAWAVPIDGYYKLDNILFYAKDYSLGDIVDVENRNGELFVVGLVKESGHSTIRIIFNDLKDVAPTREYLNARGCESEVSDVKILISVDIPPTVGYKEIKEFLEDGERVGKWNYEEACIASANS